MSRGLCTLIAALVLACALLGTAAPGRAAVPRAFFGIALGDPDAAPRLPLATKARAIRATGAGAVNLSFNWNGAQSEPGGPIDFAETDRVVAAAARRRLDVLPVLVTSPVWARVQAAHAFSPPVDPAPYAAYARALVGRYGPRGSFWSAHPRVPRRPIRSWQIWTEPVGGSRPDGFSVFWRDDRPFAAVYVALLRAAGAAIKAADPGARVVLAGLVGRSWETLERLYDAGAGRRFDAVSLHPYTGRPADVVRIVRHVRDVLRRHGDGRLPILITEVGWPSFDADVVDNTPAKLARVQRWWLRETLPRLVRARRRLGIESVAWHTLYSPDRSSRYAFDYAGLLRWDASWRRAVPKPSLRAFRAVVRQARRR